MQWLIDFWPGHPTHPFDKSPRSAVLDPLSLAVVWVVTRRRTKSSVLDSSDGFSIPSSSLLNRRSPVQNGSTLLFWTGTTRLVQFTRDSRAEWTHDLRRNVPREAIIWREREIGRLHSAKERKSYTMGKAITPNTGYRITQQKNQEFQENWV